MNARGAMTWIVAIVAVVMVIYVVRNPQFRQMFSDLFKIPPLQQTTTPPTDGGGGGQPTVQGDYPYQATGSATEMKDQGQGTRHYASGKPDDVTHEWRAKTSAKSYMIVIDITLTDTDHDDTISFKYGGTHMGSGWYDCGYSFNEGKACMGKEENHPSTDQCEVTGNSIGNLVNKPAKLAAININKGDKLELWSNLGGGWQKDAESSNGVTGFKPNVSEDETTIRIDAAPGIEMRSAQVFEISGTGTTTEQPTESGSGNLATVLTASMARKKLYNTMYTRAYSARYREDGDFIPVNYKLRSLKYNKIGGL